MSGSSATPSRRGLLRAAVYVLPGGIVVSLGLPGARFLSTPLRARDESVWIDLGSAEELARSLAPREVRFHYQGRVGYRRGRKPGMLLVVPRPPDADRAEDETKVLVLSAVCTHKGCNVSWSAEEAAFACPCHRGRFDAAGRPVAGPPTEPLVALPTEVREGNLFARIGGGPA